MSDQPNMESPQSRLEAMLGDIQDTPVQQDIEEPQEVEVEEEEEEVVDESTDVEEEVEEDSTDDEELEADEETEEEDSDEEQTSETVKLKVNGEEIEKPLDEVVALAQQGLDYTKKTQEVAEQRKELETLTEQLKQQEAQFAEQAQLNNLLIEDVAKITNLDQQLSQYKDVDWQKLTDSDFVEAQKLFMQYNQLQQERDSITSQFETKRQQALAKHQEEIAKQVQKGKEQLSKEIPNWSPETTQEVISFGKDLGFTDNELNAIIDPRHVKTLYYAGQWLKLQNKKPVIKKKVSSAKPVVKPSSKDTKSKVNSNAKKLRDQLRKSGKGELASQLIEQMI
jgi:hypothetical protein